LPASAEKLLEYFYLIGPIPTDVPPSLGYQLRYTLREIYRFGIARRTVTPAKRRVKTFAELPADTQDGFLQGMEKNAIQFATIPAPVFFSELLVNTKEGYFSALRREPPHGGLDVDRLHWRACRLH